MALADPGTPPLSRPTTYYTAIFNDLDLVYFVFDFVFVFVNDIFVFDEGVVFVNDVNVWTTLWSCSAPADPRQEGRVYFSFP